jgi:hypothetical protein
MSPPTYTWKLDIINQNQFDQVLYCYKFTFKLINDESLPVHFFYLVCSCWCVRLCFTAMATLSHHVIKTSPRQKNYFVLG